jgi:hypothetical protein
MQPLTGAFLIACPICRSGRMIRIERFLRHWGAEFLGSTAHEQFSEHFPNPFNCCPDSSSRRRPLNSDKRARPSQKLDASEAP